MVNGGTVNQWSSTQATIALSVGEAECHALAKTAAEGLGMVVVGRDLGHEFNFADLGQQHHGQGDRDEARSWQGAPHGGQVFVRSGNLSTDTFPKPAGSREKGKPPTCEKGRDEG